MVEASHRAEAAAVEVLENRIRLAVQALAPADFGIDAEREAPRQRQVLLVLRVGTQVACVAEDAPVEINALVAALGGNERTVAAVARPADGDRHRAADRAEGFAVVEVVLRQRDVALDRSALVADAEEHRVELAERHAQPHRHARRDELVLLALAVQRLDGSIEDVDRARDAVDGEIRVDGGEHQRALRAAGVDFDAEVIARAEHVVLLDRRRQRELVGAREARAQEQVAGRFFLDRDREVDLVLRARHFVGLDVHFAEVAEPVDAVARQLDLAAVVPRRFELAELAAHDLVARARVAGDVDSAHVDAALQLGHEVDHDLTGGAIDVGTRLDLGERVAEGAEALDESLRRFGHRFGAVRLAGLDLHQRLEVFFLAEVFAFELHRRHGVGLAFGDVDGDGDVLLVGRDRNLRRLDVELEVAAVQVVGAQRLEIGIQLGARVAVGFRVPVEPAAFVQVEQSLQRALGKRAVAEDADFADARRRTFGDREGDVDAVALLRRHRRHDLGAVEAAREVLALELLLGAVGERLVERQAFADAEVLQRLDQRVLVEFLQAGEVDVGDDRTLFDDDDDDALVDLDSHVLEQAGGEERAQCSRALLVVVGVADAKRQRREYRAGVGALQALDADVLQRERFHRPCRHGLQRGGQGEGQNGGTKRTQAGRRSHARGAGQ